MVGVPTSKGCRLCLKRSVKCDETRPSCLQCQRGGRICPGYAREFKFQDEGPKLRRNLPRSSNHTGDVSHSMLSTRSNSHLFLPEKAAIGDPTLGNEHLLSTDTLSQTQCDTGLRRPISSSLEHEQLLSSFVSILFPLGDITVQSSFLGSWLWHVPPRFGRNVALDYAAMSLAYAYFGGISQSQVLLRAADLFYSRSLRSLTKAIADRNKRLSPEVLCATLLLGYYEAFVMARPAWMQHASGAALLMQRRGARQCYESAFEYSMFLACRGGIISQALATETPCFLDAEDWQSIPDGLIEFPLLPKYPEMYHAIFGHFAAIPGLLNSVRLLTNETPKMNRLFILSRAQALRKSFDQWYYRYTSDDIDVGNPCFVNVSPVPYNCIFNSIYVYRDVVSATVITTYYAYLIILNRTINRLEPSTSHAKENNQLGKAICMSVDYCSNSGYCGIQTLRFALPIAREVLPVEYDGWISLWMEQILETPKPTVG